MKSQTKSNNPKKRVVRIYQCETCGSTSDRPQTCCGEPMKIKNRRIPDDDMAE